MGSNRSHTSAIVAAVPLLTGWSQLCATDLPIQCSGFVITSLSQHYYSCGSAYFEWRLF